jgi:hypothetical protein
MTMNDYSDYDCVSNEDRAVHLAAMEIGLRTSMSVTMALTSAGFQLYWAPFYPQGLDRTPRAHVSCDWKVWLPDDIRAAFRRRLSTYEAACAGPYAPRSYALTDAETDKIATWLRDEHAEILLTSDVRYLR